MGDFSLFFCNLYFVFAFCVLYFVFLSFCIFSILTFGLEAPLVNLTLERLISNSHVVIDHQNRHHHHQMSIRTQTRTETSLGVLHANTRHKYANTQRQRRSIEHDRVTRRFFRPSSNHKRCQLAICRRFLCRLGRKLPGNQSIWVPGEVWLQSWNLKELTEGHHQEWSLWLNLTQHGKSHQARTLEGLTDW